MANTSQKALFYVVFGIILFLIGATALGYGIYLFRTPDKRKNAYIWLIVSIALLVIGLVLLIFGIITKSKINKIQN